MLIKRLECIKFLHTYSFMQHIPGENETLFQPVKNACAHVVEEKRVHEEKKWQSEKDVHILDVSSVQTPGSIDQSNPLLLLMNPGTISRANLKVLILHH